MYMWPVSRLPRSPSEGWPKHMSERNTHDKYLLRKLLCTHLTQLLVPLYLQVSLLAHLTKFEKICARISMYIQLDDTHEQASALQERRDSLCNVAKNVDA